MKVIVDYSFIDELLRRRRDCTDLHPKRDMYCNDADKTEFRISQKEEREDSCHLKMPRTVLQHILYTILIR